MRRSALVATAHHEAGHAVAAWRLGFKVRRVTLVGTEDATGQVDHESPVRGINLETDDSDRARLRIEKAIIITLAGGVAQRRHSPASWRAYHGAGDRALATELALRLNGDGETATAYLRWLDLRTRHFVEGNWRFVTSLADTLVEAKTLDAEAALAAMRKPIDDVSRAAVVRVLGQHEAVG